MNALNLLKNPIIKTVGVCAVIYFGLFANKEKPNSLGNQLAPEKVKKHLMEAAERGKFIATNLEAAKKAAKEQQSFSQQTQGHDLSSVFSIDVEKGSGSNIASCGNSVEISYALYSAEGRQIDFVSSQNLVIGEKKNWLIEKNIIGMSQGGIRNIMIPHGFQTNDAKLQQALNVSPNGAKYQIIMMSVKAPDKPLDDATQKAICE